MDRLQREKSYLKLTRLLHGQEWVFQKHFPDGETYALLYEDEKIIGWIGPLSQDEYHDFATNGVDEDQRNDSELEYMNSSQWSYPMENE